ncbi:hypothetical protein [Streptomyces phaeofaciens]|uniref:hypothetical protein n=1 Tax=Streptomyces phaeofaciens TaxID=68254 RepID=UPI0036A08971
MPEQWPTPEQAYANAPSILSEIDWLSRTLYTTPCLAPLGWEYYLRKAAVLDRIALAAPDDDTTTDARAACAFLLDMDPPTAICDPRHYVRQQYALATHR